MRSTCLYCEQKGIVTPLVRITPYWAACPVCEPEFLRSRTLPPIATLVKEQVGGLLQDKGRPFRYGQQT